MACLASCDWRKQIGVASEYPMAIGLLAHDGQRVASTSDRRATVGRDRQVDVIAKVGPVAKDLELCDFAASLDVDVRHALRRLGERFLPERLPTRNHEDHVVGHQAE